LDTAIALIEVPSPTLSAGDAADRLARLLVDDGFAVERPVADWPEAPAVVTRLDTGKPGPTLQFDGHLDTVHLPFVAPRVEDGVLYGSGTSDMKGGIAAFVEALRVLRDTSVLPWGAVLVTAHDHHEGPWGDRRQLKALIDGGYVGDAVLLPEYLPDCLALAGRGMAIFEIVLSREGEPVHEVKRDPGCPDVVAAGADLVCRLRELDQRLEEGPDQYAGRDSVFVGKVSAGEIYNQSPLTCRINGTRRWVTPGQAAEVEEAFRSLVREVAEGNGVSESVEYRMQGEAIRIGEDDPIVSALQAAHRAVTGETLPLGGKPFVDDGNTFAPRAGIPVLTHGPDAKGAHTTNERVPVSELVRVAQVYALTAVAYCGTGGTV
jgi:acetylornithine deacetylase/succinyl-diaminopimelate desuccinylase-like protein